LWERGGPRAQQNVGGIVVFSFTNTGGEGGGKFFGPNATGFGKKGGVYNNFWGEKTFSHERGGAQTKRGGFFPKPLSKRP